MMLGGLSFRIKAMLPLAGLAIIGLMEPAQAQEEREECVCTRPYEMLRVTPRGEGIVSILGRGRLGIFVNAEANAETDRIGALVDGVARGGPAGKAGIQKGDIVTKLNGRSLLQGDETYQETASAPGMRLVERARELERGDTVQIEFKRNGQTKTVEVIAGDFDASLAFMLRDSLPGGARLRGMIERLEGLPEVHIAAPESFALRLGASLPGLELVSLNPDLGDYFGTGEGVLVVSVPENSELGLKAGDVIKSIDGRSVTSPSHAMRILRSYEADEQVAFEILRKKKTTSVKGKVQGDFGGSLRHLRIERQ